MPRFFTLNATRRGLQRVWHKGSFCLSFSFSFSFCFVLLLLLLLLLMFAYCSRTVYLPAFIFTAARRDSIVSMALSDKRQMRPFVIWTTSWQLATNWRLPPVVSGMLLSPFRRYCRVSNFSLNDRQPLCNWHTQANVMAKLMRYWYRRLSQWKAV